MEGVVLERLAEDMAANTHTPWVLVTHRRPDTDALCCLWAADRFIVPDGADRKVVLVEAGEHYEPEEGEDATVLHMDVGGGPCDQHGKRLERGSSFQLLLDHYGVKDQALAPILELTLKSDNVEYVEATSIHHIFKGLPHHFADQGDAMLPKLLEQVYLMLDIIYAQGRQRIEAVAEFRRIGRVQILRNRLKFAALFGKPQLREAAFDAGAHVVFWTQPRKGGFQVGIQVSRTAKASLRGVIRSIRAAEAKKRGIEVSKLDLGAVETLPELPGWFLHDSERLILSGSRSRPLQGEEFTKLTATELVTIVRDALGRLR